MAASTSSYSLMLKNNQYYLHKDKQTFSIGGYDKAMNYLKKHCLITPSEIERKLEFAKYGDTNISVLTTPRTAVYDSDIAYPYRADLKNAEPDSQEDGLGQTYIDSDLNTVRHFVTEASGVHQTVCIYPGRFQPMGKHHAKAYFWLKKYFNLLFIATSNKTEYPISPFTFDEKKKIIQSYDIPEDAIVQVKSPYNPKEIYQVLPDNTSVVFAVGKKDADRLANSKFYSLCTVETLQDCNKPFSEGAYYLIIPHISIESELDELSGTNIRNILSSDKPDAEKKKFINKVLGINNYGVSQMMIDKFKYFTESFANRFTYNLLNSFNLNEYEHLLVESGGYGHMANLWEDISLSFADIKKIIDISLQGHLNLEETVAEKVDGTNIMVTYKDGEVYIARKPSQLANPVIIYDIEETFKDKPYLQTMLGNVAQDLYAAFNGTNKKEIGQMFDDGKNFLNLEIIYDNEVNDILYGVHALVLHGLLKYENEKLLELGVKTAQELFNKIKQNNTAEQKNFKILPPKELLIKKHINFDEKKEYFMSAVANIQGKYDLPDNATIGEYLVMWWTSFLNGLQDKYTMNLPSDVIKLLANRWGLDDKKQNIKYY